MKWLRPTALALITLLIASGPALAQPAAEQPVTESPKNAGTAEQMRPEMARPTVWGEPTRVQIKIYMIDVDEVNSADQNFAASVFYEARWNSPYLRHEGPGPRFRPLTEVWTPRLVIVNQQQAWSAFPAAVEIRPDGEVLLRQKVWGRFSQPMDLHDFPLDRQTLTVQIVAAGLMEDEVTMVPLEVEHGRASGIATRFSVPDFDILSWKAEPAPYVVTEGEVGTAGFHMQIEVGRRMPYFVMKIIIPLCLIVIMSWAPRWIDPAQVGTSMGISATAFLTLVAYLFAINLLLPPVSYITRLDRFIFLSTLMVFASLLQTVATTTLVKAQRIALVQRLDRRSRIVYPVTLLVVLAVSFGL